MPSVPRWMRTAALLWVIAITAGCGVLGPMPTPAPTDVPRPRGVPVEVAVDNRSDESLVMTVSRGGQPGPYLIVGPCEASNFIYPMDGPFTIGLGREADFSERPMPPLVSSDELDPVDGGYRLLVSVAPDGSADFEPLEGDAPLRGAGC